LSVSRPRRFTPGTDSVGDWMGPRAALHAMKKRNILPLPRIEPWCPVRSPSLYRPSNPGSSPCPTHYVTKLAFSGPLICTLLITPLGSLLSSLLVLRSLYPYQLFLRSVYSSTLRMEAVCSSEMSVNFYQATRRYIPEES
jgi:hypothetical protein